jgi:pimeloyl-ACP methyl ester carboxylesterase
MTRFKILFVVGCLLVVTACTSGAHKSATAPSSLPASTGKSTGTSASATAPIAVPAIAFTDCTSQVRSELTTGRAAQVQFSCGRVNVPADYADPTGPTIQLVLVREHLIAQKPADRVGSLLVNPGGPGASGVDLALELLDELDISVLQHFDIVGFDPRGVGESSPVSCISDAQKDAYTALDPNVTTAAGRTQARDAAAAIVKGCVTKYGSALGEFNTDETARDMDLLRAALGDAKLTYLGFSYGTRLGSVYAHEFPGHIRAEVLDGAEDPVSSELTDEENQIKGFEGAFDQFAADCLKRPACAVLGNPRQAVQKLVAAADKAPIHSSLAGEKRTATGGVVTLAVISALYDQSQWAPLGAALIAAQHGDSKQLFALADSYNERDSDGHFTNLMDANLAISCNDSTLQVTDQLVAQKAAEWAAKYTLFGMSGAADLYSCQGWPASKYPLPLATAPTAPKILVVGTVHDPATPYAGAALLAKTLGNAVELSWDGQGHTAYLKSSCIDTKVNAYLIETTLPTDDSCPA